MGELLFGVEGDEAKITCEVRCVGVLTQWWEGSTMIITVNQGVREVDTTLIKAARVLGATDRDIFFRVVIPASIPYILVGARLGLGSALTTLIAAELTGSAAGLGQMIQEASLYFRMDIVMLGIIIIGIVGVVLNGIVGLIERRLTRWQETVKK